MTMVDREAGGRFKKGVVANPFGGMPRHKVLALKKLEGLTGKAIARLEQLLQDGNGSVALGAAKEILDRNLGKVKQQVQVDVTSTHVLHLEALQFLAQKKRDQLQAIDITPHATLEGIGLHGHSTLDLSASDYSVAGENESVAGEPPGSPDTPGAVAYAPTTPATLQKSLNPKDETP